MRICTSKSTLKKRLRQQEQLHRRETSLEFIEFSRFILLKNAGLYDGITREFIDRLLSTHLPEVERLEDSEKIFNCLNCRLINSSNEKTHILFCYYISNPPLQMLNKPIQIKGLQLIPNFIGESLEIDLVNIVDEARPNSLKHRSVIHFGHDFDYETNKVTKTSSNPMPLACKTLFEKLACHQYIDSNFPDQLTVNVYQPGHGIPPHVDTHSIFGAKILIVSLGSSVIMNFRHPNETMHSVCLPPNSLLILENEARYLWSHSIPARKTDLIPVNNENVTLNTRGVRISFTFRWIQDKACNCSFPLQCDSQLSMAKKVPLPSSFEEASVFENRHVTNVYNTIADQFSYTRYSQWPRVKQFLEKFRDAILVDVGCGNGKYLNQCESVFKIGCDISSSLVNLCRSKECEVMTADCLHLPFRDGVCDAVISIAVIHHLSTIERRQAAINEILRILCDDGLALIYVWAMEQEYEGKQSVYLSKSIESPTVNCSQPSQRTYIGVHTNRTQFKQQDLFVPWHDKQRQHTEMRFYHIFVEGELEALCRTQGAIIKECYHDNGNWCVIVGKQVKS